MVSSEKGLLIMLSVVYSRYQTKNMSSFNHDLNTCLIRILFYFFQAIMQQGDTSIKPILQVIVSTCIFLSNIFELIYNYKLHFIEDIQSTLGNLSAVNSLHHHKISPVHVVTLREKPGFIFTFMLVRV